jgi:hypothetical protein
MVRLGHQRVGLTGLRGALESVEEAKLTDREAIVDRLLEILDEVNYIPDRTDPEYRTALWREYLRHRGEDFSAFYAPVDVTIRGEPGEARDRFVELLRSVLAGVEVRPAVTFTGPGEEGPNPQLVIKGETIARGHQSRDSLKAAVHRSFSDW